MSCRLFYKGKTMLLSEVFKAEYSGDGSATEFAVPFKFFNNDDGTAQIEVQKKSGNTISVLVEDTDFTVSGNGADGSGKIVFETAPANTVKLAILRNVPLLQGDDYINGQYLDMEELERSFDKVYMRLQQLAETVSRALVVGVFSDADLPGLIAEIKGYAVTAQNAANDAIAAKEAAEEIVGNLGELADEINGEVI